MKFVASSYVLESLIRDLNKPVGRVGKIYTNFVNQRPEGLWNRLQQSLLIHTILQEQIVPEIYITKDGVNGIQPKTVIEGKQRITTIYAYYNNGFKLHKDTPDIFISVPIKDEKGNITKDEKGAIKTEYQKISIAGKKFKDLSEFLQMKFLDYNIVTREIFDYTPEELTEFMFKLNNGKAMTAAQKAITKLNVTLAVELDKIAHNDFFEERISYTQSEIKRSEGMRAVLQSLIVYTGKNYNKLNGNTDLTRLVDEFNNTWSQEDTDLLNNLFLLLNNLLPDNEIIQDKLCLVDLPILIMNVDKYMALCADGECTEEQYRAFLKYWYKHGVESSAYQQYKGKSISDKSNVEGRIDLMENALLAFLQQGNINEILDPSLTTLDESQEKEDLSIGFESQYNKKYNIEKYFLKDNEHTTASIAPNITDYANVVFDTNKMQIDKFLKSCNTERSNHNGVIGKNDVLAPLLKNNSSSNSQILSGGAH